MKPGDKVLIEAVVSSVGDGFVKVEIPGLTKFEKAYARVLSTNTKRRK